MSSSTPRLELQNICHSIGKNLILKGISLVVLPGQVTCLLGPSGCGKTTTLRVIAGIDRQDSGSIQVDGKTISDNRIHMAPEARSIGLLFQDFALFPHLTVAENVAFGLIGRSSRRMQRIEELLEKVRLVEYRSRYPHELSGGQQQRVALARSLAPRPRIMLMDEPFSNLDDRLRDQVREETFTLLRDEGAAALLITHEPDEAMRMADEIVLLRNGTVVQTGTPVDLYSNPVDRETALFFSDLNIVHGIVRNAKLETPFGQFSASKFVDGADVEVTIRPQHVRIDFDRKGQGPNPTEEDGVPVCGIVERSRYMGNSSLVEFRMEGNQSTLRVSVPSIFLPQPGSRLWLSLRRSRCMLFPCTAQSQVVDPYSVQHKESISH